MTHLFINLILSVVFFNIVTTETVCKKQAGVYRTFKDYSLNNFSDSICLDIKTNRIMLGSNQKLIIKSENKKKIFKAGEVYGFFDGNTFYRYFDSKKRKEPFGYFNVIDTSGIILYLQKSFTSTKYSSWTSVSYFYSKTLTDTIKSLNNNNLLTDFNKIEFINENKSNIKKLENVSSEKAIAILQEINSLYRKHFR